MLRWNRIIVVAALSPALLPAQDSGAGAKLFAAKCAGCHGADAHGTDRGPKLAGSSRLRTRSTTDIRKTISRGVPTSGMPSFVDLPAGDLDALAELVHSMNAPAAEGQVTGNASAGQKFFQGAGACTSCHMVHGLGKAVGPDLSNVGARLTVAELREALLRPGGRIADGYELVTLHLRDSSTLRGFIRDRTNFDLHLQDLQGHFHSVSNDGITQIEPTGGSPMPAVKADSAELGNLVAYLAHLSGVKPGEPAAAVSSVDGIDFSGIVHPKAGDWPTYDGKLSGNRYS